MIYNDCEHSENNDRMKVSVGYAYVPFQKLGKVYTPEKALARGTVFPELDISINEYTRGLYDGK